MFKHFEIVATCLNHNYRNYPYTRVQCPIFNEFVCKNHRDANKKCFHYVSKFFRQAPSIDNNNGCGLATSLNFERLFQTSNHHSRQIE